MVPMSCSAYKRVKNSSGGVGHVRTSLGSCVFSQVVPRALIPTFLYGSRTALSHANTIASLGHSQSPNLVGNGENHSSFAEQLGAVDGSRVRALASLCGPVPARCSSRPVSVKSPHIHAPKRLVDCTVILLKPIATFAQ